jgi:multiple sugar transport system substrate-binding protein
LSKLDRRRMLQGGAALGAGAALIGGSAQFDWARAWAEALAFEPEPRAGLRLMRWDPFVDTEDEQFVRNIAAFTAATGVEVQLDKTYVDDIQHKATVAANVGAGPDLVWGLGTTPHLFPDHLIDVSDVADYLGDKYGGWYEIARQYGTRNARWIDLPLCVGGNYINYRQSWVEDAGFAHFPTTTDDFLKLSHELSRLGHPGGFALGHASIDANAWVHWLIWAFGGKLVDADDQVVINSRETIAALEYARELYPTFAPGTVSWTDSDNNKAFLSGELGYTNNGLSIYAAAVRESLSEVAEDIRYAYYPIGPVGVPTELQPTFPLFAYDYSPYPNACKALMAFLMEAPQYDTWLQESAGYFTQTLHAYDDNPVWQDPKREVFAEASARTRTIAYAGSLGYAAASVLADFVLVDMVAQAVTGQLTPEEAAADAERRANRYYRV